MDPAVEALARPLVERPERAALFTDFDGTLAPIVDDPAAARPIEGATDVLATLARRLGLVGVVSGRPAEFLLEHLGGLGLRIWGMYGLERVEEDGPGGSARVIVPGGVDEWRAIVDDVARRADRELPPTVGVERKGLSLTIHYRTALDLEDRVQAFAQLAATTGLVVHDARKSIELRPPLPHGKGAIVEEAAAGMSPVWFLGDDRGDLEAFDALDRMAAAGVDVARIGVLSEEAPPELLERADLVVDGPPGVLAVLRAVAEAL